MKKMTTLAAALTLAALALTGCQSADPAARSNRAEYGDIYAKVAGSSNTVTFTFGDGLFASADGGGDALENAPTQTTTTTPEIAVGVGGGSAGTGGGSQQSGLVGTALNKLMARLGGDTTATLTAEEAKAINDCVGDACAVQ